MNLIPRNALIPARQALLLLMSTCHRYVSIRETLYSNLVEKICFASAFRSLAPSRRLSHRYLDAGTAENLKSWPHAWRGAKSRASLQPPLELLYAKGENAFFL